MHKLARIFMDAVIQTSFNLTLYYIDCSMDIVCVPSRHGIAYDVSDAWWLCRGDVRFFFLLLLSFKMKFFYDILCCCCCCLLFWFVHWNAYDCCGIQANGTKLPWKTINVIADRCMIVVVGCWSKNSQWQCILGAAVFVYGDRLCCISEIRIVHEIAVLSSGHRDIIATEKPRHSLHKRTTSNCFERIDRTLIDGRNHWRHKTNDRHMPHWRHTDDDRHQCTIAVRTWRIGEQNCF